MSGTEWVLAVRVLLVLVFAVAAGNKLLRRTVRLGFAAAMSSLGPQRVFGRPAPAILLGVAEAGVAASIVAPGAYRIGLALGAALLVGFAVVVAWSVQRRRRITCWCFGSGRSTLGYAHVLRNLLLAGAAIAAALPGPGSSTSPAGVAAGALLGACAAVLVVYGDDLAALIRIALPRRSPA